MKFRYLTDICGVHYPEQELALGVIYHLHSLTKNVRVRIKVFLPESAPRITTLTGLFLGANWMERETYDFYGIIFEGHPDLRRILNVDDMVAFPMRKEFPLEDPNRTDKNDDYFGR
ncbi:NADH-quinone oxidoreductase subunit C 1 [compost metagenome]